MPGGQTKKKNKKMFRNVEILKKGFDRIIKILFNLE
jgi:hypothetical protein